MLASKHFLAVAVALDVTTHHEALVARAQLMETRLTRTLFRRLVQSLISIRFQCDGDTRGVKSVVDRTSMQLVS